MKPGLGILSPIEQKIITARYPGGNRPAKTLEEIGKGMNLLRDQVLQIEKRAVARLRWADSYKPEGGHKFLPDSEKTTRYSFIQVRDFIDQLRESQPTILQPASGVLSPTEHRIITARYPSKGQNAQTHEEIGAELGIAASKVFRLEKDAVAKLRETLK